MNSLKVIDPSDDSGPKTNQLIDWLNTSNDRLVVVVFTAEWSGSGTILRSFMGKIANEMPELTTVWVDVDDNAQLAVNLGINHVPSIILLRNHEVVDHIGGMMPRSKLAKRMQAYV